MASVQNNYTVVPDIAYPGGEGDLSGDQANISRANVSATPVAYGIVVSQHATRTEVAQVGGENALGVTMLDKRFDAYPQHSTMTIKESGKVYVSLATASYIGDKVVYNVTTGVLDAIAQSASPASGWAELTGRVLSATTGTDQIALIVVGKASLTGEVTP